MSLACTFTLNYMKDIEERVQELEKDTALISQALEYIEVDVKDNSECSKRIDNLETKMKSWDGGMKIFAFVLTTATAVIAFFKSG